MALKQRRDGEMWKDISNFNFIVIISGLLYLMLFVTGEPVCYSRTSQDKHNGQIKMVDCNGSDNICMRFASKEDVNMGQLLSWGNLAGIQTHTEYLDVDVTYLVKNPIDIGDIVKSAEVLWGIPYIMAVQNSRCAYPEDYPVSHKKYTKVTCSTTKLPTVANGSFDCAPKSDVPKGKACNLTCKDGFYPAYSNQTVCEAGTSDQGKEWSQENFDCRAITCQEANLPTVIAGFFNCSGFSVGNKCNLTCDDGYYPSSSKGTVCEENNDNKANWTDGNFQCTAITCQKVHLPTVNAGFFNCSGYSVGDKCNLTCDDGFYSRSSKETVCEANDGHKANWTVGNFQCTAITCSTTNLPTVKNGSFDCAPNSDVPQWEACSVTCSDGLYPPYSHRAVCEAGPTNQGGVWSNGRFACQHVECNEWNLWKGSEYKVINTYQTWQQSRQLCESSSSHLTTIENKEEDAFVRKIVRHCIGNPWVWIGLKYDNTEGTWKWSDSTVSTYRNWHEGEPNGVYAGYCVYITPNNGEWHYDYKCNYVFYTVCETDNTLT